MSLLDRYIAKQFLLNVVLLLGILGSFIVAVDASVNLERFSEEGINYLARQDAERRGLSEPDPEFSVGPVMTVWITVRAVADIWGPRLLQLFSVLLGGVLVAAVGFTGAQLMKGRELVAMLAAGQSLQRVARPLLIVAIGMLMVQALVQETLLPRVAALTLRETRQAMQDRAKLEPIKGETDKAGRLIMADSFDSADGTLSGVLIYERNDQGLATRVITATSARWTGAAWELVDGEAELREVDNPAAAIATVVPIATFEGSLSPEEIRLRLYRSYRGALGSRQLVRLLRTPDALSAEDAERVRRVLWGRFAAMAASILTLIIALPFFVTREPTAFVTQALKCAPVAGASMIAGVLGTSLAIPGVPAALGAFVPVAIMLPIAYARLTGMKT